MRGNVGWPDEAVSRVQKGQDAEPHPPEHHGSPKFGGEAVSKQEIQAPAPPTCAGARGAQAASLSVQPGPVSKRPTTERRTPGEGAMRPLEAGCCVTVARTRQCTRGPETWDRRHVTGAVTQQQPAGARAEIAMAQGQHLALSKNLTCTPSFA